MKIIIAIDSFKGSLSSIEAGESIKEGILKALPDSSVQICPIADGGEGTTEALVYALGGRMCSVLAKNPLGKYIECEFGIIEKTNTAIIEMSACAGITLISEGERNPMHTTTYGVGEMIKKAISIGCRNFIIGIGGSATNDGGIGMLQALGFDILDKNGENVPFGAYGVGCVDKIDAKNAIPELKDCKFSIACDVSNPLCGENGCSKIFAPQKGATPESIEIMDAYLNEFAKKVKEKYPHSDKNTKGCGAAGGLGFAFLSFLNSELISGIELAISKTELEKHVEASDIVITGEGKIDNQTSMGKVPSGVAKIAKKHSKPVIAFAGCVDDDISECNKIGIDAIFPILRKACSLSEAMDKENAKRNLSLCAEQVFNLIKTIKK